MGYTMKHVLSPAQNILNPTSPLSKEKSEGIAYSYYEFHSLVSLATSELQVKGL